MPRLMPRFDLMLARQSHAALRIVTAGETMRRSGGHLGLTEWSLSRLESLYELAFLRIFAAWEMCQEAVFVRALCGFTSASGQETLVSPMQHLPAHLRVPAHLSHYHTLHAAESAALNGRRFLLWHDPNDVIRRCQRYIRSGTGHPATLETTIASDRPRLEQLSAIRHRIVHTHQTDAKVNFDNVTRTLAIGKVYDASRPGKFLRDWDRASGPPLRWLVALTNDLINLAGQLV